MPAAALAAVAPLQVVFFGKYNVTLFAHVIIFRIEFRAVGRKHSTKVVNGVQKFEI